MRENVFQVRSRQQSSRDSRRRSSLDQFMNSQISQSCPEYEQEEEDSDVSEERLSLRSLSQFKHSSQSSSEESSDFFDEHESQDDNFLVHIKPNMKMKKKSRATRSAKRNRIKMTIPIVGKTTDLDFASMGPQKRKPKYMDFVPDLDNAGDDVPGFPGLPAFRGYTKQILAEKDQKKSMKKKPRPRRKDASVLSSFRYFDWFRVTKMYKGAKKRKKKTKTRDLSPHKKTNKRNKMRSKSTSNVNSSSFASFPNSEKRLPKIFNRISSNRLEANFTSGTDPKGPHFNTMYGKASNAAQFLQIQFQLDDSRFISNSNVQRGLPSDGRSSLMQYFLDPKRKLL